MLFPLKFVGEIAAEQRFEPRHSPGTPGTCFSGAPDTIRTCDRWAWGRSKRLARLWRSQPHRNKRSN